MTFYPFKVNFLETDIKASQLKKVLFTKSINKLITNPVLVDIKIFPTDL